MSFKEVAEPTIQGSYGTIFYQKDGSETYGARKEKNYNELAKRIYEQSVRDQIPPAHPEAWDKYVQQRSKLLIQGTESPLVVNSLLSNEYALKNPVFNGALGSHGEFDVANARAGYAQYLSQHNTLKPGEKVEASITGNDPLGPTYAHPTKQSVQNKYKPAEKSLLEQHHDSLLEGKESWGAATELTGTAALHAQDRLPGGSYHVPLQHEPYNPPLRGEHAKSAYITTTPKVWPAASNHPTSSFVCSIDSTPHLPKYPNPSASIAHDDDTTIDTFADSKSHSIYHSHAPHTHSQVCSKSNNFAIKRQDLRANVVGTVNGVLSKSKSRVYNDDDTLGGESLTSSITGNHTRGIGMGSGGVGGSGCSNVSSLQQALISCGRLQVIDSKSQAQQKAVQKAISKQVGGMRMHGEWLQHNLSRPLPPDPLITHHTQSSSNGQSKNAKSLSHSKLNNMSDYDDTGSIRSALTVESDVLGRVDNLYSKPYSENLAGLPFTQRVAIEQQAKLQRSTSDATKALGDYRSKRDTYKPSHQKSHSSVYLDGVDEDDDDVYAKPAWREKKESTGRSNAGMEHKGLIPVHPSLGSPLMQSQLVDLHGDSDSIASSSYSRTNYKRYGQQLSEHLDAVTAVSGSTGGLAGSSSIPRNPFRPSRHKEMQIMNQAKPHNPLEPRSYKPGMKIIPPPPNGAITCVIRPEKTLGYGIPTEDEVHDALSRVTRRSVLAYDTRIVETGALCKALQLPVHPTPGVAAIIDLHHAFITAAACNPNPWQLKREQVAQVIMTKIHWFSQDACRRLISAYDPTAAGVIRYVRLTGSLMCCINPGLSVLITTLARLGEEREAKQVIQRERDAMRLRLLEGESKRHRSSSESGKAQTENDTRTPLQRQSDDDAKRESDREHDAELFLLKLIFSLYEDCEGGANIGSGGNSGQILDNSLPQTKILADGGGLGVRLEDLVEMCSCCCTCIEDELAVQQTMAALIQHLFVIGQKKDDVVHHSEEGRDTDNDHPQHDHDDISVGSHSMATMSSNFSALSRFTPKSAPQSPSLHSKKDPHAPFTSHRANSSGRIGVTSQERDRLDYSAKRAAERWRESRGLGRHGVLLGKGGVVSQELTNHGVSIGASLTLSQTGSIHSLSSPAQDTGTVLAGGDSVAWQSVRHTGKNDGFGRAMSGEGSVGGSSVGSISTRGAWIADDGGRVRPKYGKKWSENSRKDAVDKTIPSSRHTPTGRLHSTAILHHLSLKSTRLIPRVSQQELIAGLLSPQGRPLLAEFLRQLARFRSLCFPYEIHGSVSYSEAKANPTVPYGKMNL